MTSIKPFHDGLIADSQEHVNHIINDKDVSSSQLIHRSMLTTLLMIRMCGCWKGRCEGMLGMRRGWR